MSEPEYYNQGIYEIGNALADEIHFRDLEDGGDSSIRVASKSVENWNGTILPWCNNSDEISSKAIEVINMNTGAFICYLFQNYETNDPYYVPPGSGDLWDRKIRFYRSKSGSEPLDAAGALDIIVQPDRVWGWSRQNKDSFSNKALETLEKGAEVAVGVLGDAASGWASGDDKS